jgi:hypothetical protein
MTILARGIVDPANDWLEVLRLDRKDWRISDARVEKSEPRRLLGYIERLRRDRYEILWLTEPVGWAYATSFDLALAAFAHRDQFAGTVSPQRDPSLASFYHHR